jgi:hypothetical protein
MPEAVDVRTKTDGLLLMPCRIYHNTCLVDRFLAHFLRLLVIHFVVSCQWDTTAGD